MADFEVIVPEGYVVVETDKVIASETLMVYMHFSQNVAERHAANLNADRLGPLIRWVVEPASKELRKRHGWLTRWVVVPYQNVLMKIDELT